jgi:hypothetical protein
MKSTASTVSLLCAAALTALTACSDGGDTAAADKAETSRQRELGPAERLARLTVTEADLGIDYAVEAHGGAPREVTVDKPRCTPLAKVMNRQPLGTPRASLTHVVTHEKAESSPISITLAAYDAGAAKLAMESLLARSVESCSLGFTATAGGTSSTYASVAAGDAVTAGDESLAYKAVATDQGVTRTIRTTVVRSGDVIAVYRATGDAALPSAVLTAQNAKLG